MRELLSLTLCIVFLSFTTTTWEKFTSLEGRFSVLVPGKMELKQNELETKIGKLVYMSYVYQSSEKDADNLVYIISYCDYPEQTMHSDSTELLKDFFKATIESSVESVEGELLYEADDLLDGHTAKIWRVLYNDGTASIKTKACMVGRRYYSIQAISLKEKMLNSAIEKFMDSFRIIEPE